MRKIVTAILALTLSTAHAVSFQDDDGDFVTLTQEPCPAAVLANVPEGYRGYFTLVHAKLGKDTGTACAALIPVVKGHEGPQVYVLFESKAQWLVDLDAFSDEILKKTS